MARSDFFWGAAAALSLGLGSPAVAAPSLKAIGNAAAGAHSASDEGDVVVTPEPGSLSVIAGAVASDVVVNDSPPPDEWQMEAMVTGSGTARYGALAGRAHAEASSVPANSFFLAGGQVSLILGFTDGAEVLSDTLAPGTPVTLTFVMTLEGTAIHFIDGLNPDPDGTGAAARHEVEVRDLDDVTQPFGEGALVINSRGVNETSGTFEFDTAIGHRLEIVADLFVSAGADSDYAANAVSEAAADVVADQTAELFYQPSGDVTLLSESGHDYAVPEPGRGTLLVVSGALLLLRRPKGRCHGGG